MRGRSIGSILALVLAGGIGYGAELVCAPQPRPMLAHPRWQTNGFSLHLDGASNATYLIEVSTNLSDWTVFSTNAGGTWIGLQLTSCQTYVRAVLKDPVYPLFNFAVRAEGVELIPVVVDSYDSSDPRYSTNGGYDPLKVKDGADLALGSGFEGENSLANSKIQGRILTVPNAAVTLGPNAQIGSTAWHSAGNIGIEPGWMTDNLRPTFMPAPVQAPFTTGAVPAAGVVGGVLYEYVLESGDYVLNRLNGGVCVVGNARLLVTGSLQARGILVSSNASLQIFCAAADASFQPIVNLADVTSFQYYGLASNVTVSFSPDPYSSSGLLFKGVICAPNATCVISGGGGALPHLYGACIVRYLRAHQTRIHFDEALKRFCVP